MEEFKGWLEILYFMCGPAVVVIAYLALGQIRVAKEQIEEQKMSLSVTSKRDALKLTAEQVTLYGDKIIPLTNTLDEKLELEGIEALDRFEIEFESGVIKVIPPKEDCDFTEFTCIAKEFVDVANSIESFSTYFVSGVANERVAYLSLGSTFCDTMNKISPILIPLSNDGRRFSATLRLFAIWGERLESEDLEKQKLQIDKKLKSKIRTSVQVIGENT